MEEREARRTADTLLARLMDNTPAQQAPADVLAPSQGYEAGLKSQRWPRLPSNIWHGTTGTQGGSQRSWRRRMFGSD